MDKVHYILWLMQILATVHVTGRFADGGNHATEISSMKQKTRAPTKLWTSRSWWKEVPGQNETKLYATSSKHFAATHKLPEAKLNIYRRFQLDNKMTTNKRFLDPPITPSPTRFAADYVPGNINERKHSGTNHDETENMDFLSQKLKERNSFQGKGGKTLIKGHDYQSSKLGMNTLGFPNVLYMAALGPTSNSTNVFISRRNNKKKKREKRKFNENKKNTFDTYSSPVNSQKHERVFASTGSSSDSNLSSLKSNAFDYPFRHIEETQGFAYPASNGLTQIDRDYFRMIREEAVSSHLFFTNVSTILKHFPIINPEGKFSVEDLPIQPLNNNGSEVNKYDKINIGAIQYAEGNFVYDTNRAGNDPSKDVILNNNQPRLNTADLLQNPHRLKWANKMVDERTKDDKNSMRGGKKNRETKWAMFETTKNTKDEQKTLRKYKNTQRQLGNFWRHDNDERNTFKAKEDESGQKQTEWRKEEKSFRHQTTTTSPYMYSRTNVSNGSLIEYKQEVMANNNNGCHVNVDDKKLGKNCIHGPSVPFSNDHLFLSKMVVYVPSHKHLKKKNYYQINHTHEHDHHRRDHRRNHYNHTLSQQARTLRDKKRKHQRKNDTSQEATKSWGKQSQNGNTKKTNIRVENYNDGDMNLEHSRALMAERDLELIHHKHFRQHVTNQEHKHHIDKEQGRELPISSSNILNANKNRPIRNRPKFTYHKVPGFSADSLHDQPTYEMSSIRKQVGRSSSHDITLVDNKHNTTVDEKQSGNLRNNGHGDQSSPRRRNDGTRRIYGKIETSFSDRYLVKSTKGRKTRPRGVVAVSLPEINISSKDTFK